MDVRLRKATVDDVPLLETWDSEPDVAASGGDDDAFDWVHEVPRHVPWRELLIAEVDGRPVGFMQLIDAAEEETHYWGEVESGPWAIDIWIGAAADRSRGIGAEMMRQALERCFARPGVDHVLIDPLRRNERAIRFYERLGFHHVGIRWFDTDECAVMRFDRPGTVA
ncbi:MAG: GNAT family N-acetyltransferase [Ilumatobacteraceae bacterium]